MGDGGDSEQPQRLFTLCVHGETPEVRIFVGKLAKKLMEEGIGRLAIVYVVCLFGFIIWLGLFISWLFFHGMTPPLAS